MIAHEVYEKWIWLLEPWMYLMNSDDDLKEGNDEGTFQRRFSGTMIKGFRGGRGSSPLFSSRSPERNMKGSKGERGTSFM